MPPARRFIQLCATVVPLFILVKFLHTRHAEVTKAPEPRSRLLDLLDISDISKVATIVCSSLNFDDPSMLPAQKWSSQTTQPVLCRQQTLLFIGFSSMSCMLEQTLISYIAQGWPPHQIIVFDNTGEAYQNLAGSIPFGQHNYLDYRSVQEKYGVSIYMLPTKISFSQLQNQYLMFTSRQVIKDFYWTHQDVLVRNTTQTLFYDAVLKEKWLTMTKFAADAKEWAFVWFYYDRLAHVNVRACLETVGLWDVFIPFYPTDCDYYGRTRRKGLEIFDYHAGTIYDVSRCLEDPTKLYDYTNETESLLIDLASTKGQGSKRNSWQGQNLDGSRSSDFGHGYSTFIEAGRKVFKTKWGTNACDIG